MVIVQCPGQVVGCKIDGRRGAIEDHIATCPMATMSTYFTSLDERQKKSQRDNDNLRRGFEVLNSKLETLQRNHDKLAQSLKKEQKERRRSLAVESSAASAGRIEEVQSRIEEIASDYTARLDNATSENARLHMELINASQQNRQQFYTINGALTALRQQFNHMAVSNRLATGTGATTSRTISGASAGGGVSLDEARREPPKL